MPPIGVIRDYRHFRKGSKLPTLYLRPGYVTYSLLTRSPLSAKPKFNRPFDLHVLAMPPAFVLSQDQTLRFFIRSTRHGCPHRESYELTGTPRRIEKCRLKRSSANENVRVHRSLNDRKTHPKFRVFRFRISTKLGIFGSTDTIAVVHAIPHSRGDLCSLVKEQFEPGDVTLSPSRAHECSTPSERVNLH